MTAYQPGDVVEIISRGDYLYHNFPVGSLVTLGKLRRGHLNPVWSVSAGHPDKPGRVLHQDVAESDFKLHTPAVVPPKAQTAEDKWFDSLPTERAPEPVQVLGDHWALATDEDLTAALGGLRFELAMRKEETADGH